MSVEELSERVARLEGRLGALEGQVARDLEIMRGSIQSLTDVLRDHGRMLDALVQGQAALVQGLADLTGKVAILALGQAELTGKVEILALGQADLTGKVEILALGQADLTGKMDILVAWVNSQSD